MHSTASALKGNDVIRIPLLSSGDARAYCAHGYLYLIDPIAVLLAEALRIICYDG